MPDQDGQTAATSTVGVVISDAIRQKYPVLADLIIASESMNDGERQYWVDIIPVMTPEQIAQLQSILQNERDQLAAIDEKYGKQIAEIQEQKQPIQKIEEERRAKAEIRTEQEKQALSSEEQSAEDILKKIEDL